MLEQYAPVISEIVWGTDAREKEATLEARIRTYKALKKDAKNQFMKNLYSAQIAKLEAQLEAVREQADEERTAVATTQAGKVGGTVLLVAGSVTALAIAWYFIEKARATRTARA